MENWLATQLQRVELEAEMDNQVQQTNIILPLSTQALEYMQEVERRRLDILAKMSRLPVATLIWGPAPSTGSIIAQTRILLRDTLIQKGHLARFSEDLYDPNLQRSLLAQQIAQVESHDIVLSIPETSGSIAEIHEFARMPGISRKIVTFLDYRWNDGYSNKTLLELKSAYSCEIEMYDHLQLPGCIISKSLEIVQRIQDISWMLGRRV